MMDRTMNHAIAITMLLVIAPLTEAKADPEKQGYQLRYDFDQVVTRETGDSTGIFHRSREFDPPIMRETGDSTGIFMSRSRVPIERETGDSTGIFNWTPRFRPPVFRETGDATGIFQTRNQIDAAEIAKGKDAWLYKHLRLGTFLYCDSDQGNPRDYSFLGIVSHNSPSACHLAQ